MPDRRSDRRSGHDVFTGAEHHQFRLRPIERHLEGKELNWRLVCKGQLNMELTGEFNFDTPHHYTYMVIATDLAAKELPAGLTLPELQAKLAGHTKGAAGLPGKF